MVFQTLNEKGIAKQDVLAALDDYAKNDADWKRGRTFSLVFYPGEEVAEVSRAAYNRFAYENGLNPSVFKSLKQMESEVVAMTLSLLNAPDEATGSMTSGGTESILCAVKAAKKYAISKNSNIVRGNVVMPATAHPAFNKAADYFELDLRIVPCVGEALEPDLEQMKALIDGQTVMIVGSAPAYPHGFIDPLDAINKIAIEKNVWFHVDACVGGFIVPFLEQLGHSVPPIDFRYSAVHSISLDIHKYGYGPKGSSVVVYRNAELRKKQYFVYSAWPGGLYASPAVSGTRAGGAIAASWAVMNFLGQEGYRNMAEKTFQAAKKIQAAINSIEGLKVVGNPLTTVFSFTSTGSIDIYRLGDELTAAGWHLDRQLLPPSLHLTVSNGNVAYADDFIRDLQDAVKRLNENSLANFGESVKQSLIRQAARLLPESWIKSLSSGSIKNVSKDDGNSAKTAPLYGLMGELKGSGTLEEMVLDLLSEMNKPASK